MVSDDRILTISHTFKHDNDNYILNDSSFNIKVTDNTGIKLDKTIDYTKHLSDDKCTKTSQVECDIDSVIGELTTLNMVKNKAVTVNLLSRIANLRKSEHPVTTQARAENEKNNKAKEDTELAALTNTAYILQTKSIDKNKEIDDVIAKFIATINPDELIQIYNKAISTKNIPDGTTKKLKNFVTTLQEQPAKIDDFITNAKASALNKTNFDNDNTLAKMKSQTHSKLAVFQTELSQLYDTITKNYETAEKKLNLLTNIKDNIITKIVGSEVYKQKSRDKLHLQYLVKILTELKSSLDELTILKITGGSRKQSRKYPRKQSRKQSRKYPRKQSRKHK